ncbi:MAG TPA: phosphopantetheine-binding protein [Mycobacterium sp.]|nr:phosphopantetheine-binding protein [Mycobacterium sp.]
MTLAPASSTEFDAAVCALIAEHTNLPVDFITPDRAFDDLPLDSLGMLELILLAEAAFGIVALDDNGIEVHTVGDAIAFLASKLPVTQDD